MQTEAEAGLVNNTTGAGNQAAAQEPEAEGEGGDRPQHDPCPDEGPLPVGESRAGWGVNVHICGYWKRNK